MTQPMPPVKGLPAGAPIDAAGDLSDALAAAVAPRVARLGYLGGFFAVAARQPEALSGFIAFTEALKQALPEDLTEVVALRVAHEWGNEYELQQHIALAATMNMTGAWVSAVRTGDVEASELTGTQRRTLELVNSVLNHGGRRSQREIQALVADCGPDRSAAVVLLIGRYLAHASAANVFGLVNPLSPGSPPTNNDTGPPAEERHG